MEASQLLIRRISAGDTYPIRQQVLRPGKPLEEVHFAGDDDEDSFHLGAFVEGELLGITSFMKNRQKYFQEEHQYQMRGMAVMPQAQGKKVGQQLVREGERILREEKEVRILWFNARESAEQFYAKNGYRTQGDYFEIPDVCTHIVMYKAL